MKMIRTGIWLLLAYLLVGSSYAQAQDRPDLAASLIPDSLREGNIWAVTRFEETKLEILSRGELKLTYTVATTILNPKGSFFGHQRIVYESYDKMSDVKTVVYDAFGKRTDRVKNKDVGDYAYESDGTFLQSTRVRFAQAEGETYPYTVVTTYTQYSRQTYVLPTFQLPVSEHVSMQGAALTVRYPELYPVRFKCYGGISEPTNKNQEAGFVTLDWSFGPRRYKQPPALSYEAPPNIGFVMDAFQYEDIPGRQSTWQEYGAWFWDLYKGRNELSESTIALARSLTLDKPTTAAKVEALYLHMQKKCRYIGVQLGIGGLQTFPATYVEANSYGDCKALSNYLFALCTAVGIESFPVLIGAGEDEPPVDTSFVSDQFNHVILCVPNKGDTLWYECTSSVSPAGSLGTFTADRYAVLVTPKGGVLVRTPPADPTVNAVTRTTSVSLQDNGDALIHLRKQATGYPYTDNMMRLASFDADLREKWLRWELKCLPTFEVTNLDFSTVQERSNSGGLSLSVLARGIAQKAANRFLVYPNVLNRFDEIFTADSARTVAFRYNWPATFEDTVTWQLPPTRRLRGAPEPVQLETRFGSYESSYVYDDQKGIIYYHRRLVWKQRYFEGKDYAEFQAFWNTVREADAKRLVLMPGT